jgi:prenyltransferase beta subunit
MIMVVQSCSQREGIFMDMNEYLFNLINTLCNVAIVIIAYETYKNSKK